MLQEQNYVFYVSSMDKKRPDMKRPRDESSARRTVRIRIVRDKNRPDMNRPDKKRPDKNRPDKNRPRIVDKILEKLMHSRMINYLDKFKILYDYQFGFRKNYSTSFAVIDVVNMIQRELYEGNLYN